MFAFDLLKFVLESEESELELFASELEAQKFAFDLLKFVLEPEKSELERLESELGSKAA